MEWFDPRYLPWLIVAFIGALLIVAGIVSQVIQLWVSIRDRESTRVPAGDPWDGRSLEWSMSAPPPEYNFAVIPQVHDRDAFTWMKQHGIAYAAPKNMTTSRCPKTAW